MTDIRPVFTLALFIVGMEHLMISVLNGASGCSLGRKEMPVREILPFTEDGDGLDFGEFWADPVLVGAALGRLADTIGASVSYCLSFHAVDGTDDSYFEPYGGSGLIDGLASLPEQIWYRRLLVDKLHRHDWPILGEWVPGPGEYSHPGGNLSGCRCFVQIRLKKSFGEYAGFFKAGLPESNGRTDEVLRDAYRRVKAWVDAEVFKRRHDNLWASGEGAKALETTHQLVELAVGRGRLQEALQRVCSLITSNLGADFNRIVALAPNIEQDKLICIYGHGGDGSDAWAARVQFPLARDVHTIEQLQRTLRVPPADDPLFADVSGTSRLELKSLATSTSVLARICRAGGSLNLLPRECVIEDGPWIGDHRLESVGELAPWYNIAGRLTFSDPMIAEFRGHRPNSVLFSSRNAVLFALPFAVDGRLIAIVMTDLASWPAFSLQTDILPRVNSAKALLAMFAKHFEGVKPTDWQTT